MPVERAGVVYCWTRMVVWTVVESLTVSSFDDVAREKTFWLLLESMAALIMQSISFLHQ